MASERFNIVCSSKGFPMSCNPRGKLFLSWPAGTEIAGNPAKLTGTVKISFKYIETGSSFLSPILNAALGVDGVNIASTS